MSTLLPALLPGAFFGQVPPVKKETTSRAVPQPFFTPVRRRASGTQGRSVDQCRASGECAGIRIRRSGSPGYDAGALVRCCLTVRSRGSPLDRARSQHAPPTPVIAGL